MKCKRCRYPRRAVLQARKSSTLRDLTGLSAALTIKITPRAAARASRSECRSGSIRLPWPRWRWYFLLDCCLRSRAWRLLAIQDHRRRLENYRRPHRAKSGRLCSAVARSLRHLRRSQQRRLRLLFRLWRQPASRPRLFFLWSFATKETSARFCNRCGKPL